MEKQVLKIDIEEIMTEIRKDIQEKGYKEEMLSFHKHEMKDGNSIYEYSKSQLQALLNEANQAWMYNIELGSIPTRLRRKVLKKDRVIEMYNAQRKCNLAMIKSLNQILGYIDYQEELLKEKDDLIELLEEKVQKIAERVDELEKNK